MITMGHILQICSSGSRPEEPPTTRGQEIRGSHDDDIARGAYRSAATLSLLILLWGTLSLIIVPWEPFWLPNIGQSLVAIVVLACLARTWGKPRRRIAEVLCVAAIVYTLALHPWTAVVWCELGRPMEAFTVPQVAMVAVALVAPARWKLTVVAICLFVAECVFVIVYARVVGLAHLVPISEPIGTFGFALTAFGMWFVRHRRYDITCEFVRVQGEIRALARVRPHLVTAHEQLEAQIARLARVAPSSGVVGRALERLDDLRSKLGQLVAEPVTPTDDVAVKRLIDHDAQLGASVFAAIGFILSGPALMRSSQLDATQTTLVAARLLICLVGLFYLVSTRNRPSSQRALWVVLVLYAVVLAISVVRQYELAQMGAPYAPFLSAKLLMGVIGLTLTTRFRLGVVLIVTTCATALVMWFAFDLSAKREFVVSAAPWTTIIFMFIALATLFMSEQRQLASIQLLRAKAEVSAMHRRAVMFLALRDRLNSPLQTLVLGAMPAMEGLPPTQNVQVHDAIDHLVELSHDLAGLDEIVVALDPTFDPDHELQRQI